MDYIPSFREHAKCLIDLTSKRVSDRIPWTVEHSNALQSLQDLLCEATVKPLYIVDFTRPFNITVDASKHCVAGYLAQVDENGREKPVAFASQKLSDSQALSWATIEKEAYAVIFCLRKFRNWIFGSDITVYSDHCPLKYLTESAPSSSKHSTFVLNNDVSQGAYIHVVVLVLSAIFDST